MSALPPKADILQGGFHVRYVPIADICEIIGAALQARALKLPGLLSVARHSGVPLWWLQTEHVAHHRHRSPWCIRVCLAAAAHSSSFPGIDSVKAQFIDKL